MARIAYGLYSHQFLHAVSVGFIPLRWEDDVSLDDPSAQAAPGGSRGVSPRVRRRYLEQELLEVSAVGIPANPNALALGYKSGAVEKSDVKELLEILTAVHRGHLPSEPSRVVPSAKTDPSSDDAEHFLRQLHSILRS